MLTFAQTTVSPADELNALLSHPLLLFFGTLFAAWLASRIVHEQVRKMGVERSPAPGEGPSFGWTSFFSAVTFWVVTVLGLLGIAGTTWGLVLVHVVYGLGFTTLFFRNFYAAFPTELVRAATIDGAGFFRIFWRIMLPSSGPIIAVSFIWQFTNIWNDFLFGASFASGEGAPMTVALNNLVSSSTGVKEYNVHFAGAIMAALPTLVVYIVAGRYFVRGLMAGSVKG